jgi:arylformamidase
MNNDQWQYLSYELSADLSNYGGSKGIEIEWIRRIDKGDTSNNSALHLPSHSGTHIDYPFHFSANGKNGSQYSADQLVFDKTGIIDISSEKIDDYLIMRNHLHPIAGLNPNINFLIIKTGFTYRRSTEEYWKYNWGFHPETATFLKNRFPDLKAIGFDLISLSAYQQRETGRIAHKEFLEINDILIVEDMDLKTITHQTIIQTLIISPMRFHGADGAPVNVIAQIDNSR